MADISSCLVDFVPWTHWTPLFWSTKSPVGSVQSRLTNGYDSLPRPRAQSTGLAKVSKSRIPAHSVKATPVKLSRPARRGHAGHSARDGWRSASCFSGRQPAGRHGGNVLEMRWNRSTGASDQLGPNPSGNTPTQSRGHDERRKNALHPPAAELAAALMSSRGFDDSVGLRKGTLWSFSG